MRDYLVGQLEDLGLPPTVQEATSARTKEGTASIARVHNIHARIEGSNSTGHVLLVGHYDSVPRGPGAADDGAGVASILEIARAITSGPALMFESSSDNATLIPALANAQRPIVGSARYHTPEDSPANLGHASLQHMGSTVLAATRYFAGQDLGAPLTYFTVLGELIHYPQGLAVPLAVLAAVVFAATLLYARSRRGGISPRARPPYRLSRCWCRW